MPYRITPFVNGQIYHIYNRGVEKRITFEDRRDYNRFLKIIGYYQLEGPKPRFSRFTRNQITKIDSSKKIVDILAYCLMPNHFHILVLQLKENGVSEFLKKVLNSYTRYYNTKHDRIGSLFQGMVKAALITRDEQLLHVSRYIHLNPLTSLLVKNLNDYDWSSYQEYIEDTTGICNKNDVMDFFKSPEDYQKFVLDQAEYAQTLHKIKHEVLEEI